MGEIEPKYNCQLFCIRNRKPYPQVIGANRNISCGGFDLNGVEWKDNTLSGQSELVRKDTYALYLSELIGCRFKKVICKDADIINNQKMDL